MNEITHFLHLEMRDVGDFVIVGPTDDGCAISQNPWEFCGHRTKSNSVPQDVAKRLPRYQIPVALLGRLATSSFVLPDRIFG